jgi:hypothetical protein
MEHNSISLIITYFHEKKLSYVTFFRFCGNNSEFSPATNRAGSGVTFNSLSELDIFSVD